MVVWGCEGWVYLMSCSQSPLEGLSSTLIQVSAIFNWRPRTTRAATRPTPARILEKVPAPLSSSETSSERVGCWVAAVEVGVSGLVGGARATVAFGKPMVAGPDAPGRGVFAVFRAMVGAPTGALVVASLMVGAPTVGGFAAVLRGMVGAGAGAPAVGGLGAEGTGGLAAEGAVGAMGAPAVGGLGAPAMGAGAVGAFGGPATGAAAVGGLTGAGVERFAEGTAGGASAALSVTRTVSFFNGTLEVCLEAGLFSFSLMLGFF